MVQHKSELNLYHCRFNVTSIVKYFPAVQVSLLLIRSPNTSLLSRTEETPQKAEIDQIYSNIPNSYAYPVLLELSHFQGTASYLVHSVFEEHKRDERFYSRFFAIVVKDNLYPSNFRALNMMCSVTGATR